MTQELPVVKQTLDCTNGKRIGTLELNVPATLNSLTLDMVDQLQAALDQWQQDDTIAAVFIFGSGEKAFCAGGDVQALHASAVEQPGGPCVYAETFFAREYRMNFTLHNYSKPLVCWGHGIVMGGGLGIFAGCSHRVVTERTRFAMPEVTIALFPDVGGSYFLNKMPGEVGRFLALTAASFNGADGVDTGFATAMLRNDSRDDVLEGLKTLDLGDTSEQNDAAIVELLNSIAASAPCESKPGFIQSRLTTINELCSGSTLEVADAIAAFETEDDWLAKARAGLMHGSPLAVLWIDRQLQLAKDMSLADVFRSEVQLGTNIVRYPEFAEGVRALLIDKDRSPDWAFKSLSAVPSDLLDSFFKAPWTDNPLADLV